MAAEEKVGSQKVFEDDRVVVWYFDLAPGELGGMHTHRHDYAVRVLSAARLRVIGPDGEELYTVDRSPGTALTFRIEGEQIVSDLPGMKPIPITHQVHNIGETPFREVLIEFKDQSDG